MKIKLFILALFCGFFCFSQTFSERDYRKFERWGIDTSVIDWSDEQVQQDFKTILKYNRKRKRREFGVFFQLLLR